MNQAKIRISWKKLLFRMTQIIFAIVVIYFFTVMIISFSNTIYDPDYNNMHKLVFQNTEVKQDQYIIQLKEEISYTSDYFALGDIYLILARLLNSTTYYKKACSNYKKYNPENDEEQAIVYETLASINCNNKRDRWLIKASNSWQKTGKNWRSSIIKAISLNNTKISFETNEIKPKLNLSNASTIIIGSSSIIIKQNNLIVTQVERVLRDWLSHQMIQSPFRGYPLKVFSEKDYYTNYELRPEIGWHEGGRLIDIMNNAIIRHKTAVGTMVAYNDELKSWYACDEKGIFRFSVSEDKLYYPTTRFLNKELAMVIDTHGINMLVDTALTTDADIVIGCCDYPGKIKAALYLSQHNISVLCFTDRFLDLALGHNSKILGSPMLKDNIYGNTPIEIRKNQKIAVTNTDIPYPFQYYDTPFRYFSEINKTFPLQIYDFKISKYNQTRKIFTIAEQHHMTLVGYRVFNSYDYKMAKQWLEKSIQNKIILFHSSPYPYGVTLAKEFPEQVGFDDPNPIAIS